MTTLKKTAFLQLLASGKLEEAIEELFVLLEPLTEADEIRRSFQNLILLSGQLQSALHQGHLGLRTLAEVNIECNRISGAVFVLIDELPESFWAKTIDDQCPTDGSQFIRGKVLKARQKHPFEFDLFVSYAHEDETVVLKQIEVFRGYGLRVFASSEAMKINVGQSFFDKIGDALQKSKDFLLVCTPRSLQSEWVKTEYETFFNEFYVPDKTKRRFFILRGADIEMNKIPVLLRRLQNADSAEEIIQSMIRAADAPSHSIRPAGLALWIRTAAAQLLNNSRIILQNKYSLSAIVVVLLLLAIAIWKRVAIEDMAYGNLLGGEFKFNLVTLKNVGSVMDHNRWLFYTIVSDNSDSLLTLPLSDKTLLQIEMTGEDLNGKGYVYYYSLKDGENLNFSATPDFLYCNGKLSSIIVSNRPSFITWIKSFNPDSITSANTLMFEDNLDTQLEEYIKKLASVNPYMGVAYKFPNYIADVYINNATPKWIHFNSDASNDTLGTERVVEMPFDFQNLRELEWLQLYDINKKGTISYSLTKVSRLPKLEHLTLSSEDIANQDFSELKYIRTLRSLKLLGDIRAFSGINEFVNLNELILSKFNTREFVFNLPKLESLHILSDTISPLRQENFKNCRALRWLKLPLSFPQRDFEKVLSQNSEITILDISLSEFITDINPITENKYLRGIHLKNMDYTSMDPVGALPRLKYVAFVSPERQKETRLTTEEFNRQIEVFRKKYPHLRIIYLTGFCLGSGWILLMIPLTALVAYLFHFMRHRTQTPLT